MAAGRRSIQGRCFSESNLRFCAHSVDYSDIESDPYEYVIGQEEDIETIRVLEDAAAEIENAAEMEASYSQTVEGTDSPLALLNDSSVSTEMDIFDIERSRKRLNGSPENMEEVYSSNAVIQTIASEPRKRRALCHTGPKMCDCGCGQSDEFHTMRACSKCYLSYSLTACYSKFKCSKCLPSSGK